MIKVFIADDHAIVREGLKQIVSEAADMLVADEAGNGNEVLEKTLKGDFDVVILDITMPGINGLDALKQIKCHRPELPILVLSMHPEEQYASRVLKAGASGYLTKESAPEELITSIRRVSKGMKYVSPSLAQRLVSELGIDRDKALHEMLSDREYQVMCKLAAGKQVKQIAEELSLSVKTISTYRRRILEKMDMKSTAELVRYAMENDLSE